MPRWHANLKFSAADVPEGNVAHKLSMGIDPFQTVVFQSMPSQNFFKLFLGGDGDRELNPVSHTCKYSSTDL